MAFNVVSFAAGKKSGSGGGSGDIKTQPLNVTENGTYIAPSGRAYTPVNVNVEPTLQNKEIDIIENGQHLINPDSDYEGLNKIVVNVSVPEIEVNPLHVTNNGEYTPITGTAYGPVIVNVSEADEYSGPYEVQSSISKDQILETNGLIMTQNLTIKKISVLEVNNPSGGYTVTIGI